MPYKDIEVPAEIFLKVNDIEIYYAYRDERYDYLKEEVYSLSWYEADEFEVSRLPLFDEDQNLYEFREDYHRHLIIASIARGDLDFAMIEPFKFAKEFASYTPNDLGHKLKVYVSFEAESEWVPNFGIGCVDNPYYKSLVLCNEDDVEMLKFPVQEDSDIEKFFHVLFSTYSEGDLR
ncbi:hypothetical protein [Bacillus pumilus]|uniref:hypothetical protein n=1 Tax=Bacillus pumilus TaxID=1408 RepID=UPI002112EF70|nr:hypothetical protein [Bacillus pumilus]UUD44617.1 hypothetical protein NPA43_18965 [Bacillus pumilus]